MNGGGNLYYAVRRASPGTLEVVEEASSDGLCTDDAGQMIGCPSDAKRVALLEVPEGAQIAEAFAEVELEDGHLRQRRAACE